MKTVFIFLWSLVEDVRNFVTDPQNRKVMEQMRQVLVDMGLWVDPPVPPEKPKRKPPNSYPQAVWSSW
jgi:hypothetical protein